MAIIRSNAGAHARRTNLTKVGSYPKSVGRFKVSTGKEGGRQVWTVTGFAKKAKKTYYNEANAADFMRRQSKYDRTGTSAGGAKRKKTTKKGRTVAGRRRKSSGASSFAEAGVTLRRLGYKGKLSAKTLDTLTKRRKKIKALKAKGASAKKWEGVRRAKKRAPARRRKSTKSRRSSTKSRRGARRNPHMSDTDMIDYLLENPAQLDEIFEEDYLF